jgi:pimeloyl-ACP methyl ester carboxylesterase
MPDCPRRERSAPQAHISSRTRGVLIALIVSVLSITRAFADEVALKATISRGVMSDEGWITHTVESECQAKPTEIRVLVPDNLDGMKLSRVMYVLPVEAARESKYGDGLAEVKRLDLHNKHGLICVAPTFAHLPWYADHPTDKSIRQETYFVRTVVTFVDRVYPVHATREGRLLLGFSKSGWGAWSLLARHPDLFDKAAAWDAPLDMQRFDLYGAAQVFGHQDHFDQYRVLPAIQKSLSVKTLSTTAASPRLILTGYDNFRMHHLTTHRVLDEAKIPHVYRDGPQLKHAWNSGWVEEAVTLLLTE